MRPLSTQDLLAAWEVGCTEPGAVERALALLAVACPEVPREALAQLTIGDRARLLLALRDSAFGSRLIGLADCPQCGERLELEFDVAYARVAR